MAKIQHNNFSKPVNDVFAETQKAGALHLYVDGNQFFGRTTNVGNNPLFHSGTTGYLGLQQDPNSDRFVMELFSLTESK